MIKGRSHKYVKREPTGKPKPKWRYWYKIPGRGLVSSDGLKVGSSFKHGKGDDSGHFHVKEGPNDKGEYKIVHDETKEEKWVSVDDVKKLLREHHKEGLKGKRDKLLQNFKAALKHGKEYHQQGRRKDIEKYAEAHGDAELLAEMNIIEGEHKKKKEEETPTKKANDPELERLEIKARKGDLSRGEVERLSKIRKRPLSQEISVALSPSKRQSYHVRLKVVDLDDLVTSHNEDGQLNNDYDQRLQSRHRGRLADAEQIRTMASGLEPMALLYDSRRTDEGSPIIGEDGMVESGNGRTMAMKYAARSNNQAWQLYQDELRDSLSLMGISESELAGKRNPVLIRERLTGDGNMDFRVDFAESANTSSIKRMSAFEEALRDANNISPEMLEDLKVNEDESIESALSKRSNAGVARDYLGSMPPNEAAALVDKDGNLSRHGRERFKAALYLYSLPGDAGKTIAQTFVETSDHDLKNFDAVLSKTLPRLAMLRAKYNKGERKASLDIMPDLARTIQKLDHIKRSDQTVDQYLRTPDLFAEQTTPLQNDMLVKVDQLKRSPKKLRQLMNHYIDAIEQMPDARQEGMALFGGGGGLETPEDAWNEAKRRFDQEQQRSSASFRTRGGEGQVSLL
jgi:hypothetical protein